MTVAIPQPAELFMRMPTWSVVVPNYNHAQYIEDALGNIFAQSIQPLEVIVVDDGSTDDSCAVVARVQAQHPSLKLSRLPTNKGVNFATNYGLRLVHGDYVCVLAADDLVMPEFAAKSLGLLRQYENAGFCFSERGVLLSDSNRKKLLPLFLSNDPRLFSPAEICDLLRYNFFTFPSNTIFYRRKLLLGLGGFHDELCWHADWFANIILALRHGACYVPEVLAWNRVSPHSYSARGLRNTDSQRRVISRFVDLVSSDRFGDIATPIRNCALMPEASVRVLIWLIASPRHRGYITLKLATRLLLGSLWRILIPFMPDWLHQMARRLTAAPARLMHLIAVGRGGRS